MKRILILIFILTLSTVSFSQINDNPLQRKGYVVMNNGEKVEGIVWLESKTAVWLHQSKVKFLPIEEFEKLKKMKRKFFKTYKPKDILGYGFDDIHLKSLKYSDNTALGFNMVSKKRFIKILEEGNINIYIYYQTPPRIQSGDEIDRTNEEWAQDNNILVQKGNGKVIIHESANILDLIGDCETVKEKYLSGGYGFKPKNNPKKKGLKKLISKALDNPKLKDAMLQIAIEYNQCEGNE